MQRSERKHELPRQRQKRVILHVKKSYMKKSNHGIVSSGKLVANLGEVKNCPDVYVIGTENRWNETEVESEIHPHLR